MKTFSDILPLIRPNILKLAPYSSARDEFKEKAEVYLDANENPFESEFNRYPDSHHEALRNLLCQQNNRKVQSNQLILGNGSDEIIDMVVRMFCEPAVDSIIISPPTYGMYEVVAAINNVAVKKVNQLEGFQIDVDAILQQVDASTKIIFVCSPNNPSGNVVPKEDLLKLLNSVSCMVFLDEAYIDFANTPSFTTLLGSYPNLIIGQTLSKFYGLAGLRIGMGIASKEIISVLNKIKPPYNINSLSQQIAQQQLQNINYDTQLTVLLAERERMSTAVLEFSFVKKVYPSDANFILIKVLEAKKLYDYLVDKSVIVRLRTTQYLCENGIRITIGLPQENDRLLQHLSDYEKSTFY